MGYNSERRSPKDYFTKVWHQLATVWEEKICLETLPSFFLFFEMEPYWLAHADLSYNAERGPSKDPSTKVWSQLAQFFQRKKY